MFQYLSRIGFGGFLDLHSFYIVEPHCAYHIMKVYPAVLFDSVDNILVDLDNMTDANIRAII